MDLFLVSWVLMSSMFGAYELLATATARLVLRKSHPNERMLCLLANRDKVIRTLTCLLRWVLMTLSFDCL